MGSDLMIYGIGTDITKVSRFEKWVKNEEFIKRFFNSQEIMVSGSISAKCEHYAARFAVKEAFSKALGTGISGFNLQDVFITNDKDGKPKIHIQNNADLRVELQKAVGVFAGLREKIFGMADS